MSEEQERGKLGEKMAAEFLQGKGYSVLATNYVYDKAEVDIIAEHDRRIVFVEVKTRESAYLSAPEYTVSPRKQKQIIKAADAYLKEHHIEKEARFDIVTVIVNSKYKKLDHLEDAFFPTV
jgi:putative endonuclease